MVEYWEKKEVLWISISSSSNHETGFFYLLFHNHSDLKNIEKYDETLLPKFGRLSNSIILYLYLYLFLFLYLYLSPSHTSPSSFYAFESWKGWTIRYCIVISRVSYSAVDSLIILYLLLLSIHFRTILWSASKSWRSLWSSTSSSHAK
jgi:hypothetical protein